MDQHLLILSTKKKNERNVLPFQPTVRVSLRSCASGEAAYSHGYLTAAVKGEKRRSGGEKREAENSRVSNSR